MSDLGLVAGRPTYDQVCEASHGTRRNWVVLRPSQEVSDWSQYSGNCYVGQLDKNYQGLRRDVIGVKVLDLAPLTRVETLAECVSTANTYFYDPEQEFSYPLFNWDDSYWDIGILGGSDPADSHYWDQFTQIYVNLGGTDPATTSVLCELGFYMGQAGEVHASLGDDLLAGAGSFESLTGWTTAATSPDTCAVDANPLAATGTSCVKLTAAGVNSDSLLLHKTLTGYFVVGRRYRLAGYYETGPENTDNLAAKFCVHDGTNYIDSSGRDFSSTPTYLTLQNTGGVARRFTFDFIAWDTDLEFWFYAAKGASSAAGYVRFDNVTIRRIWSLNTYDPRIPADGLGALSTKSPGIFFAGKSVGSGSIEALNGDAGLDPALGQLAWIGHTIEHYIGGELPGVGTLDREEWNHRFNGIIQDVEFDDEKVIFPVEDARSLFHKDLPPNFLSTIDTTIAEGVRGKPKPLLFGSKTNIQPPRIGYDPTYSKYPKCLVADCTDAPNGIKAVDYVYAYEIEDAAEKVDSTARLTLRNTLSPDAPTFKPYYGIASITNPTAYTTTITKNASTSWTDNIAISREILHGDGYVEFVAGSTTTGLVVKLVPIGSQYLQVDDTGDFAAYLTGGGALQARSGGANEGSPYSGLTTTTKIRVERIGTTVYLKYSESPYSSWTTLRTFTNSSSVPLCVKVDIYSSSGIASQIALYGFGQFSMDVANGTFTVLEDVTPVRVTLDNQFLNFDVGGSELTATIPTGLYTRRQLSCEIAHQMKQQTGASALCCYYTDSTNLFTVKVPSGTLNLRITTGTNKDASLWGAIGFARDANSTGSTSYSSDAAVYDVNAVDSKMILRCTARGYIDDASGTYTGTADELIERGCDITNALVRCWLKRPASDIDTDTFGTAGDPATGMRPYVPESLAIYLDDQISSQKIFEALEASNLCNIVIAGDGKVSYVVDRYTGETPALQFQLEERDYLERPLFTKRKEELYRSVTVLYDRRPDNGNWKFESAEDPSVANRYKVIDTKPVETYVRFYDTAKALASRYLVLAQRPPTRVRVVTGAKLFRRRIGDIVAVTRRRALSNELVWKKKPCRVIAIEQDALKGRVVADLVASTVLPAGVNCAASCQQTCEVESQNECLLVSQTGCEVICQTACQLGCQVCGESGFCQTACELSCQSACQLSCQTACQLGCQATCQLVCQSACEGAGCQTSCESSCQTSCELSCQSACETACQGCGQTTCQTGCQVSCQSCGESGFCQVGCEVACQACGESGFCQTTCETAGCETVCEYSCQGLCQTACQVSYEEDIQIP